MKPTITTLFVVACLASTGCNEAPPPPSQKAAPTAAVPEETKLVPFVVPNEADIKDSVLLASIRRGKALIHSTKDSLPRYVGARLTCANCHVQDGTVADAMPLVGAYSRFPQYRARSGEVDLLEDRVNDCFQRSMNGKAIPVKSPEMRDIVTYIAFLSRGIPPGKDMQGQGVPKLEPLKGDTARGHQLFLAKCAKCHNVDGGGNSAVPPLWGAQSYNIGAGMARVRSAAAFIHQVMPLDSPRTLTPQQAFDVATYINTRPRPDFKGKENDWPRGGAPADVAYPTIGSSKTAGTSTPNH
ncbi:MAG TPA: c-type cytochrome [Gemmatimonadaceae bacterium]|nr:c-type cytochrome [Gemmatimonadaceae bacterium]